ncbi:hypothetical protein Q604_UNBC06153G0001, partial [human gut metagenome]
QSTGMAQQLRPRTLGAAADAGAFRHVREEIIRLAIYMNLLGF